MNPNNSYISTSIDEVEKMMSNQRIGEYPQFSDYSRVNLPNKFILSNQATSLQANQQYNKPNYVQPNHLQTNSIVSPMNSVNNILNISQRNLAYQIGLGNAHRIPNRQANSSNAINQMPKFNVPKMHKYLDPSHYANLTSHTYPNQSTGSHQFNNASISSVNHLATNKIVNRDLISPNITGLPEAQIRKASPSGQDNIYANTSIVSRYVPQPPTEHDTHSKYSSTSTLNKTLKENEKYGSSSNEFGPLYDPVYFRTNSQLSFNSTKDDSTSTYTPSIRSLAGSRQPINALLNNELDQNLAYDKSPVSQLNSTIDPLNNDKEVDYLTDILVKEMRSSTDPEFFGMCYKCGKRIYEEGNGCVTALGQLFHAECFSCHVCDKTLRGKAFYLMESRPYCEDCYLNTLDKCFVCNKPILDRVLRAMGNQYHPSCFCCVVCGKCLDGVHFTVDHKNKLHCIEDFHEKFAPRCSVCSKPIIPENGQIETVRIVALDRIFHVKCYKCEDCGVHLSSENGKGCFPLDDHILCKECNNSRFQQFLSSTRLA